MSYDLMYVIILQLNTHIYMQNEFNDHNNSSNQQAILLNLYSETKYILEHTSPDLLGLS